MVGCIVYGGSCIGGCGVLTGLYTCAKNHGASLAESLSVEKVKFYKEAACWYVFPSPMLKAAKAEGISFHTIYNVFLKNEVRSGDAIKKETECVRNVNELCTKYACNHINEDQKAKLWKFCEKQVLETKRRTTYSFHPNMVDLISSYKEPFTILLVGQTGTGKTSLLKLLRAFPELLGGLGVEALNRFAKMDFDDTTEPHRVSGSISDTQAAHTYEISLADIKLRVIDTSGLADTGGPTMDDEHERDMMKQIDSVGNVNCILIVVNGTVSRVGPEAKYVLSTIASWIPKDKVDHIRLVCTHVSHKDELIFEPTELAQYFGVTPKYFYLNNPWVKASMAARRSAEGEVGLDDTRRGTLEQGAIFIYDLLDSIKHLRAFRSNHIVHKFKARNDLDSQLTEIQRQAHVLQNSIDDYNRKQKSFDGDSPQAHKEHLQISLFYLDSTDKSQPESWKELRQQKRDTRQWMDRAPAIADLRICECR